jgi:hypothetical protein
MKFDQLFQKFKWRENQKQTASLLYKKMSFLVDKIVEQKFPPLGDIGT